MTEGEKENHGKIRTSVSEFVPSPTTQWGTKCTTVSKFRPCKIVEHSTDIFEKRAKFVEYSTEIKGKCLDFALKYVLKWLERL